MRIELPSPSWADVHRAQDDAHTLTLPVPRPLTLSESMLLAGCNGDGVVAEVRAVAVACATPLVMTLTL